MKILPIIKVVFLSSFLLLKGWNSNSQESQQAKSKFKGFTPEYVKKIEEQIRPEDGPLEKAKLEILVHPKSAEAHFNLAEAYSQAPHRYVNNDYSIIADEYQQAIQLKSDYAEAYKGLARVYGRMNEFKKQFDAFDKAISLNSNDAEVYCYLGFAHLWGNRAKSSIYPDFKQERRLAAQAFEKAISIKSDYAEAYRGLGQAYYDIGRYKNAIVAYSHAIRLEPNNAASHLGLGQAYIDLGDKKMAVPEYEALLQISKEAKDHDADLFEDWANILLQRIKEKFGDK